MKVEIHKAEKKDIHDLAVMIGEYRAEMTSLAGFSDFDYQIQEEKSVLEDFLDNADYAVFIARSVRGHPLGYLTIFESHPYRDEPDGILEQLYVRSFYRQRRIAHRIFREVKKFAGEKRWRRIVATLPTFLPVDAVMAFFEKQGFSNARQRKQWFLI